MDSPHSVLSRSPLQMRQASPFPLESTNRRVHYVTAAAPNPSDRHRSSGKFLLPFHFHSPFLSSNCIWMTNERSLSAAS